MADTPEGREQRRAEQLAEHARELDAAQAKRDSEMAREQQEKAWHAAAAARRAAQNPKIAPGAGFVIAPKTILGPPSPTENES